MISELRQQYPFEPLLKMAGVDRSVYYYHMANMNKPDKYAKLKVLITEIFNKHKGKYGRRRICAELQRENGEYGMYAVGKVMDELNIKSKVRIKKYKSYRGWIGLKISD